MNCEQAELLLAELLAGDIGPGDRRAIERHLLECASCRADFDRARAGQRAAWPDAPVPPALVAAVRAAVARPPLVVRFLRAGTAAAAALILILFVAASPPRNPSTPPARPAAPILAAIQEGAVGALFAKDEDGRPVGDLGLKSHVVSVEILDGIAKTTVEENFENHTDRRLEGTFHFPLPPDASISRLALEVNGKMEEGTCLERERAREVFESIVRRMQDPALLEWMPGGMFKCRVFPIEPRATKRVLVAYTQALPFFRGRMTYVYPLASEKTRTHPPGELRIDVRARVSGRLEKIESPSHRIDVQRRDEREAAMSFRAESYRPENDFVVAMETTDEEVRVVPHKADGDDGTFALFLTPRGAGARKPQRTAFVLDVSASVSAPELEVAKRLVRAMMERRIDGDRFQVLAHHIEVESSGDVDLRAANDFMDRLKPVGGSDVLKALLAADADEVIYIGEGTPTMGETEPAKILEAVKGRRIRTVAVGSDANTSLLERLGGHARISPNDNINLRVAEIAETLGSPVLSGIRIDGGDALYDVVGVRDVFFGERLVVAGRYRGPAAKLVITGRDYRREVEVAFPPKEEGNTYVKRLWAQRRVADLLARGGPKEEVVALGVRHQIMTPYTSFLVLESEQMWKDHQLKREVPKQDEVLGKLEKKEGSVGRVLVDGIKAPVPVEDPRAKAIREAYEAQVSRERLETTLAPRPDAGRSVTTFGQSTIAPAIQRGELRPETETRIVRSFRSAGDLRIDEPAGEIGPGFTTNESARLESYDLRAQTFHTFQKLDPLIGLRVDPLQDGFWTADVAGLYPNLELHDVRDILLKLQDVPGPRVELVSPQAGGAGPLTGARFRVDNEAPPPPGIFTVTTNSAVPGTPITDPAPVVRGGRLEADAQVFVRQQETQLAQIQELTAKVEEHRAKLAKALNEKSLVSAEVQFARQESEKLREALARLEGGTNSLVQTGVTPEWAPRKPLQAKTTAVANEIGLVVVSKGKDDGVLEGDEFVVYRQGDYVARIVIDRADLRWSAGKVVHKRSDPRPGDDILTHVPAAARTAGTVSGAEGEAVLIAGKGLVPGQVVAISRDSKFVALVQMVDATLGRVWRGMAVGRVLPGDRTEVVTDVRAYLAALPEAVRVELGSRLGLDAIRAKMRAGR